MKYLCDRSLVCECMRCDRSVWDGDTSSVSAGVCQPPPNRPQHCKEHVALKFVLLHFGATADAP